MLGQGMSLALRSSAATLFLGLRWAGQRGEVDERSIPEPEWSPRLWSKIVLDEVFFASEVFSAAFTFLPDHRRIANETLEAAGLYQARGWLDDPASYHLDPPRLEDVEFEHTRSHGIPYRIMSFESGYEPHAGEPGRGRWPSAMIRTSKPPRKGVHR